MLVRKCHGIFIKNSVIALEVTKIIRDIWYRDKDYVEVRSGNDILFS